jgi:hypothetical protein
VKLSQLRPCDACGEAIGFCFFRLQVEQHVVDARAVQKHMGLAQMFGGSARAHGLAEVFTGDPDDATKKATERHVLLCNDCFCMGKLAAAWEKVGQREVAGGGAC